jgi:hypothetical protein
MLIHDRFVFIHLQKTGGSFLADALKRSFPPGSLVRGAPGTLHPGWDDIPAEARGRPVLVYVRNPWDWYVSWYHFVLRRRPDNLIFDGLLGGGANDFATTVRNACGGISAEDDPRVAELLGKGLPLVDLMAEGHDFYTARFLEFVGAGLDSDLLNVARYESLADDAERFLERVGVALSDETRAALRSGERINAGERGAYRDYYDDELRDLVGDACSLFVRRFGYRF